MTRRRPDWSLHDAESSQVSCTMPLILFDCCIIHFSVIGISLVLVISCPCKVIVVSSHVSILVVSPPHDITSLHWVDYYIMSSTSVPSHPLSSQFPMSSLISLLYKKETRQDIHHPLSSWYLCSYNLIVVLCWAVTCHYPRHPLVLTRRCHLI